MRFTDQMNNTIRLGETPSRIVSLVPSQTELLHYLGLETEVVGITKFCIHPDEWFRGKSRVGGTKNVDRNKVIALKPDLIIGNKEENEKLNIEELSDIAPVWMSDIATIDDALEMIKNLGEITGRKEKAFDLVNEIKKRFHELVPFDGVNNKVAYFIWENPNMLAGKGTFIDSLLSVSGFQNVTDLERYPEFDSKSYQPDFVFLSSEPFPFAKKHQEDFERQFPNAKVILVDGEYFSWYGSRLNNAPEYLNSLINKCRE